MTRNKDAQVTAIRASVLEENYWQKLRQIITLVLIVIIIIIILIMTHNNN